MNSAAGERQAWREHIGARLSGIRAITTDPYDSQRDDERLDAADDALEELLEWDAARDACHEVPR